MIMILMKNRLHNFLLLLLLVVEVVVVIAADHQHNQNNLRGDNGGHNEDVNVIASSMTTPSRRLLSCGDTCGKDGLGYNCGSDCQCNSYTNKCDDYYDAPPDIYSVQQQQNDNNNENEEKIEIIIQVQENKENENEKDEINNIDIIIESMSCVDTCNDMNLYAYGCCKNSKYEPDNHFYCNGVECTMKLDCDEVCDDNMECISLNCDNGRCSGLGCN